MSETDDGVLDLIAYIVFGVFDIPYISDSEVLGLILPENLAEEVPGVHKIDKSKLTTKHYIFLLAPFLLDREYFKIGEKIPLIGSKIPDPFEDALEGISIGDENELDDFEADKTASNNKEGTPMADGGRREDDGVYDFIQTDDSGRDISGKAGSALSKVFNLLPGNLIKYFLILVFVIIGLFVFVGVAGGSGHVMLLNEMTGGLTSGLDSVIGDLGYKVNQFVSTVGCFGNAGCIREWQMNNTQRPGSEDVGETYRLKVNGPRITGSNDVRYMNTDAGIPISFTVENVRHGLDGIKARDAQYRLMVRQPSIFTAGKAQCKTKWIPLEQTEGNNTLLPGQIAQPLEYTGNLTIKKCGLLNPVNTNLEALLQVQYNYSAMAFLKLKAMNSRNFQGVPKIKRSKTPNTPVEASIQAPNPILFRESGGKATALPFEMDFTVHTDRRNIKFRAYPEAFKFKASDLVEKTVNCPGLEKNGNVFNFSDTIGTRIERRIGEEDWFSKKVKFPEASCNFKLKNPEKISDTGETLTFTASVNYTVRQEERSTTFKMKNTLCREMNCPQIRPLNYSHKELIKDINLRKDSPIDEDVNTQDYWRKEYALCNRPQDAQPGCTPVHGYAWGERTPIKNDNGEPIRVGEGKFAFKFSKQTVENNKSMFSCHVQKKAKDIFNGPEIAGISRRGLNNLFSGVKFLHRPSGGPWILVGENEAVQVSNKCKRNKKAEGSSSSN